MRTVRRRDAATAVLAVVALAGLGACAGQPGSGGGFAAVPSADQRWCGHAARELLPEGSPATLTVDDAGVLTASAPWHVRTTLDVPRLGSGRATGMVSPEPPAEPPRAVVYGTDVALVRDGRVVAVRAGRAAPSVHEVVTSPSLGDYAAPALPFVDDVTGTFVACHGATLGGDYDLVVTDTVSVLTPAASGTPAPDAGAPQDVSPAPETSPALPDWPTLDGNVVARVGGSLPVQVAPGPDGSTAPRISGTPEPAPVPGGPTAEPAACGAPVTGLQALAAQPAPISVDLTTHALPAAERGEPFSFGQRLTNTGSTHLDATAGHPSVLVTRDGRVVGGPGEATDAIGIVVQLDPGESTASAGLAASTLLRACVPDDGASLGDPLPAGRYEVWTLWSFTAAPAGPPKRIPEKPAAGVAGAPGAAEGSSGSGSGSGGSGTSAGSTGSGGHPAGSVGGAATTTTSPDAPVSSVVGFVAVGGPWTLTIG